MRLRGSAGQAQVTGVSKRGGDSIESKELLPTAQHSSQADRLEHGCDSREAMYIRARDRWWRAYTSGIGTRWILQGTAREEAPVFT